MGVILPYDYQHVTDLASSKSCRLEWGVRGLWPLQCVYPTYTSYSSSFQWVSHCSLSRFAHILIPPLSKLLKYGLLVAIQLHRCECLPESRLLMCLLERSQHTIELPSQYHMVLVLCHCKVDSWFHWMTLVPFCPIWNEHSSSSLLQEAQSG